MTIGKQVSAWGLRFSGESNRRRRRLHAGHGRRLLIEKMEDRCLLATIDLGALTAAQGMTIYGADALDLSGRAVSGVGDVNGDGFDDLIIGAGRADASGNSKSQAGDSYVIFGGASLPATIDLASLGSAGITIFGADTDDQSGRAVGSAGDVNGDGFDDLLIGAPYADASGNSKSLAGESYVIFGGPSLPATIDLASLGSAGITIFGADAFDISGLSVSGAGDVNGDGFDDLIIGAEGADASGNSKSRAGDSYVIFGGKSLPASIDLASLGSAGITIFGTDVDDYSGHSVSGAGDVNGDGFDDLLIGAYRADASANSKSNAGDSYLIFGSATLPAMIDLANLGSGGITILGGDAGDASGFSVSGAGDVNGDGFDDVLIGAPSGGLTTGPAGDSYLIFGGTSLPATIDLASLGSAGITLLGADAGDLSGYSVSGAGDVNGDGFDDLLIGAPYGQVGPVNTQHGESYVVFGGAVLPTTIELASLGSGSVGITILGADNGDRSGWSVSGVGDIDGNGFDDVLIGAIYGCLSCSDKQQAGESYIIFGNNSFTSSLTHLGTASAETLTGTTAADVMNGAGGDDLLIGNGGADVLIGGQGNDVLAVSDLSFKRIVGGTGHDTLRLDSSGLTLDLTTLADNRLLGIEQIDISGTGNNTLTLNYREVLKLSDESNTLTVRRNLGDTVNIGNGWTQNTDEMIGLDRFNVFTQGEAIVKVQVHAAVMGRHIFYNNSFFDGNTAAAGASDDSAVASDKVALRTGKATLANYTNYSRGINGIMVDVANPSGTVSAADFEFHVGNTDIPANWAIAPTPTQFTVRPGAGAGGSIRVSLVWPDNVIEKTWLQVTVRANANTGLTVPDVFYFGNAIGDVGNSTTDAIVNATDIAAVVGNQNTFMNPAALTSPYDLNRDRQINATDIAVAVGNQTSFLSALRMISVVSGGSGSLGVTNAVDPKPEGSDSGVAYFGRISVEDSRFLQPVPLAGTGAITSAPVLSERPKRTCHAFDELFIPLTGDGAPIKLQSGLAGLQGPLPRSTEALITAIYDDSGDQDFAAKVDEVFAVHLEQWSVFEQ